MPSDHLNLCCPFFFPPSIFAKSWLFASGGQSIGTSASASVLPMNIWDWFCLGLTGLISLQSKEVPRVFSKNRCSKASIFRRSAFFMVQLSHPYMTTGKTIALTQLWRILEFEVKWALESITINKAGRCDGMPVELFQILNDDALKVLHSICQQIGKTQQWPQDWKKSIFIPVPMKGNPKQCLNYCTIALISHTSKIMLKILQARLQQYVNWELPDVQAGFRKDRGTRDQIANICWIIEKAREF